MSFKVKFVNNEKIIDVRGESYLLEELIAAGMNLPYSCKRGICDTCEADLIDGQVEYNKCKESVVTGQQRILLCQAKAQTDLTLDIQELVELDKIRILMLPARVHSMELVAPDIMQIQLRIPPTTTFRYLPGQYIDIHYTGNIHRSYSIADYDGNNHLVELHIRKKSGGIFTEHVFKGMKINELLRFEGPLGSFFIRNKSKSPIIFLAGGTGFAPIKTMVNDLIKNKDDRNIYVYWGATSVEGFYSSVPNEWAEQCTNIKFIPVLSEGHWAGRKGYVHAAVLEDFTDLSQFEVYACGSPLMIEVAKEAFMRAGLNRNAFFSDAFV